MEQRIALYLDLENLLHPCREAGRLSAGIAHLAERISAYDKAGHVVSKVGFCDRALQRQTAFELAPTGLRIFSHDGARDAADHLLIDYMTTSLPSSVTTVVIGSGDHIFAGAAATLRAKGKRIELLAPEHGLSYLLYREADGFTSIPAEFPSAA